MDAQEGSHAVSRAVPVVQTSGPEWGPCQGLDAVTWNRDMQEHSELPRSIPCCRADVRTVSLTGEDKSAKCYVALQHQREGLLQVGGAHEVMLHVHVHVGDYKSTCSDVQVDMGQQTCGSRANLLSLCWGAKVDSACDVSCPVAVLGTRVTQVQL